MPPQLNLVCCYKYAEEHLLFNHTVYIDKVYLLVLSLQILQY